MKEAYTDPLIDEASLFKLMVDPEYDVAGSGSFNDLLGSPNVYMDTRGDLYMICPRSCIREIQ